MTWVVILVALLAGSIAAAVVWRIAESAAVDRRLAAVDNVADAVKRGANGMVVTLSGTSAIVDADGRVSQSSLERFVSDLADVGVEGPIAWLTPVGDDWSVALSVVGTDGTESAALRPGTTLPADSALARAATTARNSGRPVIGRLGRPTGGEVAPREDRSSADADRLFVLKPVFRAPLHSDPSAAGDEVIGVVASVRSAGELTSAISSDLDSDVRFSVADGDTVLASSDPPPSGGSTRTVYFDGRRLSVRIQDDRPVNHDLSWFLLWISAIVVAAAGTVGLRSARYDEDRRRTNSLIGRTAELAQQLAGAATSDDVAEVLSSRLPSLLGAGSASFGVVDEERRVVTLHHGPGADPVLRDRLPELRIDDVALLADAVGSGRVVLLQTTEEWRSSFPPAIADELLAAGATTAAVIPLEVGDRGVVATIGIIWRSAPELDQRMVATLGTVKELSEQTLERAEMTDRVSRHASQLAGFAEQLAGSDTVASTVETVTRLAAGPVGAESVRIGVADGDAETLHLYPQAHPGDLTSAPVHRAGAGADALEDAAHSGAPVLDSDDPSAPTAVLPLRADGTVIGSIGFSWDHPAVFDDDLMNDLTTVSEMTAQTIRRAQLVEALQANVVRNQALADFAQRLANVRTTDQLCSVVVERAASAVGAVVADIGLIDERSARLTTFADPRPSPGIVTDASSGDNANPTEESIRTHDPVVLRGSGLRGRYSPDVDAELRDWGIVQTAHVPLTGPDGATLGVLAVGWDVEVDISGTIRAKLRTLGELCSQSVQRVRLAEAEHRLVVSLQERVVRPVPRVADLAIAERYLPAAESVGMGGDWFEGIPIDGERFAVVVGDIAGHGINAVADMVEIRAVIGSLLRGPTPLGQVFPRVAALLRQAGSGLTATSCIAVFDTSADVVRYVSAGHLPPVLAHPDGTVELLREGRQPLLGVPSTPVAEGSAPFTPGAAIALYTDGIVERRNESIDASIDRLAEAMRDLRSDARSRDADPAIEVQHLADGLLQRCLGNRRTDDDVALVVIVRTGSASGPSTTEPRSTWSTR